MPFSQPWFIPTDIPLTTIMPFSQPWFIPTDIPLSTIMPFTQQWFIPTDMPLTTIMPFTPSWFISVEIPVTNTVLMTATTTKKPTGTGNTISNQYYQQCEQGWTNHNGNCYYHISARLDNESAKRWCSYYGATLVNIHNQDDLSFVLSINPYDAVFWVYFNEYKNRISEILFL
jgi:hypothetical protein